MRRLSLKILLTSAAVVVVDQVTKAIVRTVMRPGETVAVIDGFISLSYVRNVGAAFGLLRGQRPIFIFTALAVLAGVVLFTRAMRPTGLFAPLALGLVGGGALGNLIDRVLFGRVTDFIDVHFWPVFNAADSAIVMGVGLLSFWLLVHGRPRRTGSDEA